MLQPRYEASATLGVSIDYGRTPPLELLVEDRALDRAAMLLLHADTLDRLAASLSERHGANPIWSSPESLRDHIRLDTELAAWHLVVQGNPPQTLALVANAWAELAMEVLDDAQDHAWKAMELQSAPIVLACSELLAGSPPEAYWQCLATGPGLDQETVPRLREEIRLSHGVLPILSFEVVSQAVEPVEPIAWDRSLLIISGLLLGLLAGGIAAVRPWRETTGGP